MSDIEIPVSKTQKRKTKLLDTAKSTDLSRRLQKYYWNALVTLSHTNNIIYIQFSLIALFPEADNKN